MARPLEGQFASISTEGVYNTNEPGAYTGYKELEGAFSNVQWGHFGPLFMQVIETNPTWMKSCFRLAQRLNRGF